MGDPGTCVYRGYHRRTGRGYIRMSGKHQNRVFDRPSAGRRADFDVLPIEFDRHPARKPGLRPRILLRGLINLLHGFRHGRPNKAHKSHTKIVKAGFVSAPKTQYTKEYFFETAHTTSSTQSFYPRLLCTQSFCRVVTARDFVAAQGVALFNLCVAVLSVSQPANEPASQPASKPAGRMSSDTMIENARSL